MLAVVDYGASNMASVLNALRELGEDPILVREPDALRDVSRIILPGVGAMPAAFAALQEQGLDSALGESVRKRGRPFLGICLGMQMMVEQGLEGGTPVATLGWLPGMVEAMAAGPEYKVPHMGWAQLSRVGPHPIFNDTRADAAYYFCHSYHVTRTGPLATAEHTRPIAAVIAVDTAVGVQFHPERSGPNGLRLLENFLSWNP